MRLAEFLAKTRPRCVVEYYEMSDENPRADEVTNLTPEQVAAGLREGRILLVDVREPNETAVESYPEAVDRAAVVLRPHGNSGSGRQGSCIRLSIGTTVSNGFACSPGQWLPLQGAPRRRYYSLEGGRTSDPRRLGFGGIMLYLFRRPVRRMARRRVRNRTFWRHRPLRRTLACRERLQLVRLHRSKGIWRTSPRKPA